MDALKHWSILKYFQLLSSAKFNSDLESLMLTVCEYACYLSICVHIWVTWDKFSRQGTVCLDWGAAQTPVNTSTNTRPTMGICILYLCICVCTICYIHCICLDWERAQTRVNTSTNTQLTMLMQIQEHIHVSFSNAPLRRRTHFRMRRKSPANTRQLNMDMDWWTM